MKNDVIIFGTGDIAEIAHYYFSKDSDYTIRGFTVDSEFVKETSFCGLPIVALDELTSSFPPDSYECFVALSYTKINGLRKEKYLATKELGYSHVNYISSKATVLNDQAFGENCFILEDNTIQPFVKIGDNVTLWSGNHIGHHSIIKSHSFISSHVVISGGVEIGEQCFIGVNSTLRDHISIGNKCVIGAGALMLSDADEDGVYIGSETQRSRVPSYKLRNI